MSSGNSRKVGGDRKAVDRAHVDDLMRLNINNFRRASDPPAPPPEHHPMPETEGVEGDDTPLDDPRAINDQPMDEIYHGLSDGASGSDIDFVVHLETTEAAPKLLRDLNDHLAALQLFRSSEVLEGAKCPIIKGVEKPFGFHVDIAINNDNGILNIERNRRVMEEYPALFPLLMFLKFFLFQNRLDEPYRGGISSNTLQNMILFVIQASPEENKTNLGKLLISFFKTFGTTFNYITTGISTRCGGRLFSRIALDRVNWKTPVCLCIEDPQIPGRFLGENCYECFTFRSKCHLSFKRVMSDGPVDEQSMLLRVISKPEWIIRKRDELSKQYQALLGNAVECFSLAMDEEDMRRANNKGHRNSRGKGDDRRRRREDRPYTR